MLCLASRRRNAPANPEQQQGAVAAAGHPVGPRRRPGAEQSAWLVEEQQRLLLGGVLGVRRRAVGADAAQGGAYQRSRVGGGSRVGRVHRRDRAAGKGGDLPGGLSVEGVRGGEVGRDGVPGGQQWRQAGLRTSGGDWAQQRGPGRVAGDGGEQVRSDAPGCTCPTRWQPGWPPASQPCRPPRTCPPRRLRSHGHVGHDRGHGEAARANPRSSALQGKRPLSNRF